MEWTDEVIARLRLLWAEGHSTAEIGRRMGVSKNAVVGKAHRLSLTARPSPIRRGEQGAPSRRSNLRRAVGPTLPPLDSTPPPAPVVEVEAEAKVSAEPVHLVEPVRSPVRPTPLRAVARSAGGRMIPCCWPIGEPGTRSFRFCDAASLGGKPYCAKHAQLAYVKVRDRREDAA